MCVNIGQQQGWKVLRIVVTGLRYKKKPKTFSNAIECVPLLFAFHIRCGIINQEPRRRKNNSFFFDPTGQKPHRRCGRSTYKQLPLCWVLYICYSWLAMAFVSNLLTRLFNTTLSFLHLFSPFYIDKSQTGHRSLVVVVIDLVIQHTANVNPAAAAKNMYAKPSIPAAGSDLFAQKCWKLPASCRIEIKTRPRVGKDHWNKQQQQ
jgi:hypothetical protein